MRKRTLLGNLALAGSAAMFLSGCAAVKASVPNDVLETNPVDHPVRALTDFSEGLTCMGRVLSSDKVEPVYVALTEIPDRSESSGSAGYGAKEMIVSAMSRLSQENGLVRLVAYDRTTPTVVALHNSHPNKKNLRVPDFFIRGAITQIDSSPYSKQNGSSASLGTGIMQRLLGVGVSNSNSVTMKSVTLDLNVGLISTYQILPGVSSSNTLAVVKEGNSTELTISFDKIGGIYSVNENKADALSGALRSLVEVGIIELFGKLYNADYSTCLAQLDRTNPLRMAAREKYDDLSDAGRLEYVLSHMRAKGYVRNKGAAIVDGAANIALRDSIAAYRVRNDLFPSAAVDFRMFEKMYLQSQPGAEAAMPGEGVGPIKRWLHADGAP
ncbi:MAG: hypothetical protein KAI73_10490 [Rhodospirillaceae bacterium]|nr:hypothetical protein [Rhodospirillaceae bacterium]